MKSAFITFTIYFGGNFTSCENKNGFVSKQGLRKSQVVRMEQNLRNHPGWRRGPLTEGKQGYKHCELFLQDSSIEHLGLLPGTRIYIYYLVEVVPQGRTYSLSLISSQFLSVSGNIVSKARDCYLALSNSKNYLQSVLSLSYSFLFCTQCLVWCGGAGEVSFEEQK